MKTVMLPISRGKKALVDQRDFPKVGKFKWSALKIKRNVYAVRNSRKSEGKRRTIYLHREILVGVPRVDHKNGDGLDCRRDNLRAFSNSKNLRAYCRKAPGSTSKFRGVCWGSQAQKWIAQIQDGGKNRCLGRFNSEIKAAKAYDRAAKSLGFSPEALNFSGK